MLRFCSVGLNIPYASYKLVLTFQCPILDKIYLETQFLCVFISSDYLFLLYQLLMFSTLNIITKPKLFDVDGLGHHSDNLVHSFSVFSAGL